MRELPGETVRRLAALIEMRGDECDVMVMVRSQNGLEIVSNVQDYIVQRGLLKVTEEAVMDRQYAINEQLRGECQKQSAEAEAVMSGQKPTKRWEN